MLLEPVIVNVGSLKLPVSFLKSYLSVAEHALVVRIFGPMTLMRDAGTVSLSVEAHRLSVGDN